MCADTLGEYQKAFLSMDGPNKHQQDNTHIVLFIHEQKGLSPQEWPYRDRPNVCWKQF